MAFRFKKSEPVAKGVRRICRERIGSALGGLHAGGRLADIHGVRKEIKKLRALTRLMRGETGSKGYRKATKPLREAAGSLAEARDARVRLLVFRKMAGRAARQRFPAIEKALRSNCRNEVLRCRSAHSVAQAKRNLERAGRRIDHLKIKASGWRAIEPGLREVYRRGRAVCRRLHEERSPEQFHEWRKQVKVLWYYFCLLFPALPAATRVRTDDLESLGELLGEEHDLFLLREFLSDAFAGPVKEAEALNGLIQAGQNRLRRSALKLGSRLYAEAPVIFCQGLKKHWKTWRTF